MAMLVGLRVRTSVAEDIVAGEDGKRSGGLLEVRFDRYLAACIYAVYISTARSPILRNVVPYPPFRRSMELESRHRLRSLDFLIDDFSRENCYRLR